MDKHRNYIIEKAYLRETYVMFFLYGYVLITEIENVIVFAIASKRTHNLKFQLGLQHNVL